MGDTDCRKDISMSDSESHSTRSIYTEHSPSVKRRSEMCVQVMAESPFSGFPVLVRAERSSHVWKQLNSNEISLPTGTSKLAWLLSGTRVSSEERKAATT